MNPLYAFLLQFLWFLLAWSVVAALFIAPRLRKADTTTALSVWVAPHLFRVLGVGLLVPGLSPGMPASFAISTAIGDSITAALALASLIALRRGWHRARSLVWVFNVFGSLDLLAAAVHGGQVAAALHLQAQWYVPVLGVPLMIVAHFMVFHTLLTRRDARR